MKYSINVESLLPIKNLIYRPTFFHIYIFIKSYQFKIKYAKNFLILNIQTYSGDQFHIQQEI